MWRAEGVPVFCLLVSDISDPVWQETSLWEGESRRTFKQLTVGKAVLEANLPAVAAKFSDSAGIVADGIFSSPKRPELPTLRIFSSPSLLLPKLLRVFSPNPLHPCDYPLLAISHPDSELWLCNPDFLVWDCSLFSRPQSSSVSNNSPC